jgi:hypothetical protein
MTRTAMIKKIKKDIAAGIYSVLSSGKYKNKPAINGTAHTPRIVSALTQSHLFSQ